MSGPDLVLNVRQIAQYPASPIAPTDLVLAQRGLGGDYMSAAAIDFVNGAISGANPLNCGGAIACAALVLPESGVLGWRQPVLTGPTTLGGYFAFSPLAGFTFGYAGPAGAVTLASLTPSGGLKLPFSTVSVGRDPALPMEVATLQWVMALRGASVVAFNGRVGDVSLTWQDLNAALCLAEGDQVASQGWVEAAIKQGVQALYLQSPFVYSFNGRCGDIWLTDADITLACTAPGAMPRTNTPPLGDASTRIASTMFVDESMADLYSQIQEDIANIVDLTGYAPLNSPDFTGIPTAPTANPGTSTGQIATTAFVQAAVEESTTGVSSFNARTGAIILQLADVTDAGGAPLASPGLTGVPTAPTAPPGTDTGQIATTAYVEAALAAISTGVTAFNGRTGSVTLTTSDVTGAGGAPIASPAFSGTPTAATAAPGTSSGQLATTAFVANAIAGLGGVVSFNGRTGAVTFQANDVTAVGGALIASPTFTGTPAAPTANPGTNSTQIATTAFVAAAIAAEVAGVTSFNTRTGAVTLTAADVTGAGGAPIASPTFTGTPAAPTQPQTDNSTALATTAYVRAAIAGQSVVQSFNSRTGAITLTGADVSAAGGALLVSPTFTGTPAGPTAAPGTSTTQLATTAFVTNAVSSGVTSFNGRSGAVSLTGADITGAGGALLASPTFTGTPNAPTPANGTNNTQLATTAFVQNAIASSGVSSFNGRSGAVTLTTNDVIAAGGVTSGFVNKIRNPRCLIHQRAGTVTIAAGGSAYTLDGHIISGTGGSGNISVSQGLNSTAPLNPGGQLNITPNTGATAIVWAQAIESLDAAPLIGPCTWSAYVWNNTGASITPTFAVLAPASTADTYTTTQTVFASTNAQACPNGAWTRLAMTFTPTAAQAQLGLYCQLTFPSPAAVAAGLAITDIDVRQTPGFTNGIQANPPAPEFPYFDADLARCERYYEKSYDLATAPGAVNGNGMFFAFNTGLSGASAPSGGGAIAYRRRKRIVPALTLYSPTSGASGHVRDNTDNADVVPSFSSQGQTGFAWYATASAATANLNITGQWVANAEI